MTALLHWIGQLQLFMLGMPVVVDINSVSLLARQIQFLLKYLSISVRCDTLAIKIRRSTTVLAIIWRVCGPAVVTDDHHQLLAFNPRSQNDDSRCIAPPPGA